MGTSNLRRHTGARCVSHFDYSNFIVIRIFPSTPIATASIVAYSTRRPPLHLYHSPFACSAHKGWQTALGHKKCACNHEPDATFFLINLWMKFQTFLPYAPLPTDRALSLSFPLILWISFHSNMLIHIIQPLRIPFVCHIFRVFYTRSIHIGIVDIFRHYAPFCIADVGGGGSGGSSDGSAPK